MYQTKEEFIAEILKTPELELGPEPTSIDTEGLIHVVSVIYMDDPSNLPEKMTRLVENFLKAAKEDKRFQHSKGPPFTETQVGCLTISLLVSGIPARFMAHYSGVEQTTILTLDTFVVE